VNEKIRKLWAENMDFRIKVTTSEERRFSFSQIQAIRIWEASGWSEQQILDQINSKSSYQYNIDQINNLLAGRTYAKIPFILIDDNIDNEKAT
jgi:hypothetical protein